MASVGPLPLSAPRLSARLWLALAAGLGCGACGYAGLYPRFDDGSLRIILALTSIPFGAAVVAAGVGARTAARAFALTILLAAILGVASIMLPAAALADDHSGDRFMAMCAFGAFFGAPTGAVYGIPLAILVAASHRHVRVRTHEGTDRAVRIAGLWLIAIAFLALEGTLTFDGFGLPATLAGVAAFTGALVVAHAILRLRRRSSWIDRVRSGLEPAFRLRPADLRDGADRLPRLGDGTTVIEWLPDDSRSAYRMAASGIAVAVVCDANPIRI